LIFSWRHKSILILENFADGKKWRKITSTIRKYFQRVLL
jgi:hypothetical protein